MSKNSIVANLVSLVSSRVADQKLEPTQFAEKYVVKAVDNFHSELNAMLSNAKAELEILELQKQETLEENKVKKSTIKALELEVSKAEEDLRLARVSLIEAAEESLVQKMMDRSTNFTLELSNLIKAKKNYNTPALIPYQREVDRRKKALARIVNSPEVTALEAKIKTLREKIESIEQLLADSQELNFSEIQPEPPVEG